MKQFSVVAALAIAVVGASLGFRSHEASRESRNVGSTESAVVQTFPPMALWFSLLPGFRSASKSGDFVLAVTPECAAQNVRIYWRHSATGATAWETITFPYWVTAVCRRSQKNTVLVAGKRLGSLETVLEAVTLREPEVLSSTPPGGGEPDTILVPKGARRIVTLYDDAVLEHDIVTCMLPNLFDKDNAFVKFNGSNNVYEFSANGPNGSFLLAASHSSATGVPWSANLQGIQVSARAYHHATAGYSYHMTNQGSRGPSLILHDSDLDGVIDATTDINSVTDWVAAGFADASNFVPLL